MRKRVSENKLPRDDGSPNAEKNREKRYLVVRAKYGYPRVKKDKIAGVNRKWAGMVCDICCDCDDCCGFFR